MRLLLTWSDRGEPDRRPSHAQRRRGADRGPVQRFVEHAEPFDQAWVLCTRSGRKPAATLAKELGERIAAVELIPLDLPDPSDHRALFEALQPVASRVPAGARAEVLLSAGTPQAQTIWVVLVKAGLLNARMVQVIPPAFVPIPHPEPIRVVDLDFDGFPEIRALREELAQLRAGAASRAGGLVGDSPAMSRLHQRLARVAASDLPVLLLGETGTGKELVARALHDASPRADGPFIAENCAALDPGVLASELFGHEAGAFTGAQRTRRGLFELADGGTLLLDEAGELPPRVQVSLLRVLQEGRLRRVGGERDLEVDVRVVAATHRDLPRRIEEGLFREDLYYRLRSATLELPPLRERAGDLEPLIVHFARESGRPVPRLTREAWAALGAWRWPGNVRELRAEVLRWCLLCEGAVGLEDLAPEIAAAAPERPPASRAVPARAAARTLREAVAQVEVESIREALARHDGNLSATARELDIDRNTLKRKMSLHGLKR